MWIHLIISSINISLHLFYLFSTADYNSTVESLEPLLQGRSEFFFFTLFLTVFLLLSDKYCVFGISRKELGC